MALTRNYFGVKKNLQIKEVLLNAQDHTMIYWHDKSMLSHEKFWMDNFSNFLW